MTRPIVPLLIALMAGIIVGSCCHIPDLISQISLAIVLLFVLIALRLQWRRSFILLVLLSFVIIGNSSIGMDERPRYGKDHLLHRICDGKITGEGIISENPRISPERTELVVTVNRILSNGQYIPASGRVLLRVRDGSDLGYGDFIRFHSRLREPRNFQNPGGFDYERYLRLRRILVTGSINDPSGIVLLRKKQGRRLIMRMESFRDRIREALREKAPEEEGRIIQAMTLGEKREIPRDIIENFNKTGTSHLIAISGLHVGIVAFVCLLLVRRIFGISEYLLLRWNVEKIAAVVAMLTVLFYMFVAGAGISVIRATIMVLTFMTAVIFNRDRDLYQALALAAFLILLISPGSLFDISFQLSFSAVLSIVFLTPRLASLLPAISPSPPGGAKEYFLLTLLKKWLHGVGIFGFVTLSATLGTLPLMLFYFNRLSTVGLVANLAVVPLLGLVATPLFLLTVIAIPIFGNLAAPLLDLSVCLVKMVLLLIRHFAAPPYSAIFLPTPTLLEMTAFYLLLIALGFILDDWRQPMKDRPLAKQKRRLWFGVSTCIVMYFLINMLPFHLRGNSNTGLSLTAIDVGQGNAILVRFPGGGKMLVDGGGFYDESFDIGRSVVAPYLWHQRINRIETVVLTHSHPDHLQGLLFIVQHFGVRQVWTSGEVCDSPLYQKFLQITSSRGLTIDTINDSTPPMNIEGVSVQVLNPRSLWAQGNGILIPPLRRETGLSMEETRPHSKKRETGKRALDDCNDRSLVIKLTYRNRSFLLPADITSITENRLLQSGADLKSDVLLVPHHGSGYSSTEPFIRRVAPLLGIISCGRDNIHGLPHPEVMQRYRQIKTKIFRTDRDGAVTVETDGQELKLSTFKIPLR